MRTDWWLPEAMGVEKWLEVGKIGEGGQKVLTSGYKMSKSWKCNIQPGDYS